MHNKTEIFLENKGLLFSMAYNMLGSVDEAEDMVQETFLKWMEVTVDTVRHAKAYLVKMVTNMCINYMNSTRAKREEYVGMWLPEPLVNYNADNTHSRIESYHALSIGILVMLEKLTALERAVFLLREIFAYDYFELAEIFDKTEDNCRQILKRAKEHLGKDVKRFEVDMKAHEKMLGNFLTACAEGNMNVLIELLKEDIVLFADGGGRVISVNGQRLTAALYPIGGRENVARFLISVTTKVIQFFAADFRREVVMANGSPAMLAYAGDTPLSLTILECDGEKITNVFVQTNLDKLKPFIKTPSRLQLSNRGPSGFKYSNPDLP
jgi:RNA polymerase sigma-70 factor, ECF subfamily